MPVAALATGIVALVIYRGTLLPGLGIWDTAEAQAVLPLLGTMHPTGFPAYVISGWLASIVLAPAGSPAFVVNLLSALLVACAAAMMVVVARQLGAGLLVALGVAAGFALTALVWQISTQADVHALHLALLAAIVASLLRWSSLVDEWRASGGNERLRRRADRALMLAAAVFGLSLANHALTVLLIPAVGLFVRAVEPGILSRRRPVLAALGVCLGVAALLYLELPLRAGLLPAPLVYGHPETWSGFWDVLLARQFQGDLLGSLADLPGRLRALADLSVAQFGLLVPLVPVGALVTVMRHPRYARLSLVGAGITAVFATLYVNASIDRYYLGPVFFAWTWLAILLTDLGERLRGVGHWEPGGRLATPAAVPGMLVDLVLVAALLAPTAVGFEDRWRDVDSSGTTDASEWLDDAFSVMQPDAVVISWWSYSTPMWYGQLVENRRRDIRIVDDRTRLDEHLGEVTDVIEANLDTRPVYVIRVQESDVQALTERYVIEPVGHPGNLYQVVRRQETPP